MGFIELLDAHLLRDRTVTGVDLYGPTELPEVTATEIDAPVTDIMEIERAISPRIGGVVAVGDGVADHAWRWRRVGRRGGPDTLARAFSWRKAGGCFALTR